MNRVRRRNEAGFTLVELAIVLVIVGLLLGGIIKGQEMINNAKIKRTYNTQKEIAAAIYSYFDRYGVLPGDDSRAATRWTNPAVTSGNGNGMIANGAASTAPNFTCSATSTEQCDLWAGLRQANLISGSGFSNPTHPFGGAIAVSYYNAPLPTAKLQNWIVMQNVPAEAAKSMDQQFDDGSAATGGIRGTTNYTNATTGVFTVLFQL